MNAKDRAFVNGFVVAVSTLLAQHDEPTMAADALNTIAPINWRHIDEYDRNIIKAAGLRLKDFAKSAPDNQEKTDG